VWSPRSSLKIIVRACPLTKRMTLTSRCERNNVHYNIVYTLVYHVTYFSILICDSAGRGVAPLQRGRPNVTNLKCVVALKKETIAYCCTHPDNHTWGKGVCKVRHLDKHPANTRKQTSHPCKCSYRIQFLCCCLVAQHKSAMFNVPNNSSCSVLHLIPPAHFKARGHQCRRAMTIDDTWCRQEITTMLELVYPAASSIPIVN
jgi:hypothetical protein